MKILFVTTTFSRYSGDPMGGAGNTYFDLIQKIAQQVEKVDVVAPMQTGAEKFEEIDNLSIYRESPDKSFISFESMIKTRQIVKIPFLLFNLYKRALSLVKNNDYDIVHGFFVAPGGLLITTVPTNGKTVISALGSDIHTLSYYPLFPTLYKWIFKRVDGVIYNTSTMKERLNFLQAQNMRYIPTPVNCNHFKYSPKITRLPKFVYVGRLTREKGIEILLKSFLKVLQTLPNAQLTIIGEGPERNFILDFVETNGLQNIVKVLGAMKSSDIAKTIGESYALLLPSFKEGMPAVVLEAMSVGRPIVATKVGGLKDLVTNEVGYLTDTGDIEGFSRAIVKVFNKKYSAKKIKNKTNIFKMETIAKEYLNFYESIL
jgi:glycosyltransferase involved in cell wall biosynthesis